MKNGKERPFNGKIYARAPKYSDGSGYVRIFTDENTINTTGKQVPLIDGSGVLELKGKAVKIVSLNSEEELVINIPEMPSKKIAWVWTPQSKYRPGESISGFIVARRLLNPYVMGMRRLPLPKGAVRLVRKGGETIRSRPIDLSEVACHFEIELGDKKFMKTGDHVIEVVDPVGEVIGSCDVQITRFEKKELALRVERPRWVLVGDDIEITASAKYYHGGFVTNGTVTLKSTGVLDELKAKLGKKGRGITEAEEDLDGKESVAFTIEKPTKGMKLYSVTFKDENGREETEEIEVLVSDNPASFKMLFPNDDVYSTLPATMSIKLERPDGLPVAFAPVAIKWDRMGKMERKTISSKVLETDVNGYVEIEETFDNEGTYGIMVEAEIDGEVVSATKSIPVKRFTEGDLFIRNTVDKQTYVEGETITGKIKIHAIPSTVEKVKFGYVDLISDKIVESKRVEITGGEATYEFNGIVDFWGTASVDFYVNGIQLGLIVHDVEKTDKSGSVKKRATFSVEPERSLELKVGVDNVKSASTGEEITLRVSVDSKLLDDDVRVFGALVDKRVVTKHDVNTLGKTFLKKPPALDIDVLESERQRVYALGGFDFFGMGGRDEFVESFMGSSTDDRVSYRSSPSVNSAWSHPPPLRKSFSMHGSSSKTYGSIGSIGSNMMSGLPVVKGIVLEKDEEPELVFREDFAESVMLEPVVVDGNGNAEIKVKLPDSITTYGIIIFASSTNRFGTGNGEILVRNPVFTQLLNPAEMVLDADKVRFRAIVQNMTTEEIREATVTMGSMDRIFTEDETTRKIPVIAPKGSEVVEWEVTGNEVGDASATVTLFTEKFVERSKMDQPLFIKPPGEPVVSRSQHYVDGKNPLVLDWVVNGDEAFNLGVINILPSVEVASLDGLESLLNYGYGCCEQTYSKLLASVTVYEHLKATDELPKDLENKIMDHIRGGIDRYLNTFRGKNGGFGLWDGKNTSVFHTALVLNIFNKLKPHVQIPIESISGAIKYLNGKKEGKHWKSDGGKYTPFPNTFSDVAITSYILHSLSMDGMHDLDAFQWLHDQFDEYNNDPSVMAMVLESIGNVVEYKNELPEFAGRIRSRLMEMVVLDGERLYWADGSSMTKGNVESTAYVLIALSTAFPSDASLEETYQKGINFLLSKRQSSGWNSTRNTLYASMAISRVAKSKVTDFTLLVNVNGNIVKKDVVNSMNMTWKLPDLRNIYVDKLNRESNEVRITIEGSGTCHVVAEMRKWYHDEKLVNKKPKITVQRNISRENMDIGEQVFITIECDPTDKEAIMIEQPIPSLLKVDENFLEKTDGNVEHAEINDNKICIFFSRIIEKKKISIPVKASFSGKCRIDTLKAYPMYDVDEMVKINPIDIVVR